jgi:hypothetical protein
MRDEKNDEFGMLNDESELSLLGLVARNKPQSNFKFIIHQSAFIIPLHPSSFILSRAA